MIHGSHEEHQARFDRVRAAAAAVGKPVAILADLQGPKIRLGRFADGPVDLVEGAEFTITTEDVPGDQSICSTTYKGLAGDARPGDRILIDDGNITVEVERVDGPRVVTRVIHGGKASNNKGINLPGVAVSVPAMSEKDVADLHWALGAGADIIALSFVRDGHDAEPVRAVMEEVGTRRPIIAKLEKPQAVEHLEEIVAAFDGLMVARGDLGVELPLWEVPLVQKRAVELCRRRAKPVIVATQMLESMIQNSRPTRAEASDVANAVLDGADAVMLSGETSVGAFPLEAVRVMSNIVEHAEEQGLERISPLTTLPRTRGGAITKAAAEVGDQLGARYLVAFTQSGDSARRLSRLRSRIPSLAFTPLPETQRQLTLSWGITPFLLGDPENLVDMVRKVEQTLLATEAAETGDIIVIVSGFPFGVQGTTNAMRVHTIGDRLG
jgi:pyruvate kinase